MPNGISAISEELAGVMVGHTFVIDFDLALCHFHEGEQSFRQRGLPISRRADDSNALAAVA
jgi:hypothetical protein